MIVQWHDYVELFEMKWNDDINDANEGWNEFDEKSYGPFSVGFSGP